MEVLDASDQRAVERAAGLLRAGRLVGMPTETVYGLAVNAQDDAAVAGVFEAKGRPRFDPLIVHAATAESAWGWVASKMGWPAEWASDGRGYGQVMGMAEELAAAFWPGPLTLVLPVREGAVSRLVTSGLGTVGLRVPGHPVARELIASAGVPVAAPSANRFGGISPTRAGHVVEELDGRIDAVLDGGPCDRGLESTVVGFGTEKADGDCQSGGARLCVEVLRLGSVSVERLSGVLEGSGHSLRVHRGTSRPDGLSAEARGAAQPAPGMLDRHYAPRTPMVLVDEMSEVPTGVERLRRALGPGALSSPEQWGVFLAVLPMIDPLVPELPVGLVEEPRLEALVRSAAVFFDRLRALDARGLGGIVAVRASDYGLGRAMNDRLERGAIQAGGV
ncbi:MAG: L-threonylcarbamoyladenylate synthase [Planctomycetota bacterium]